MDVEVCSNDLHSFFHCYNIYHCRIMVSNFFVVKLKNYPKCTVPKITKGKVT
jgi:hypothetical protein